MQTNVQRKFAHEGTEVRKRENHPFRALSSSFWNAHRAECLLFSGHLLPVQESL